MIMINRYDELDKTVLQILMDYSGGEFPLDLRKLCGRLRASLKPYSALEASKLSKIRSIAPKDALNDGFSIIPPKPDCKGRLAYIYYNDDNKAIKSIERLSFTIAHEIKHVVFHETDPTGEEESEADHFARYLLAPMPLLIVGKHENPYEIQERFGLTFTASCNALGAMSHRVKAHGYSLFEYESDFVDWFLENAKKGRRSGENDAIQNYDSSVSSYCYSPDVDENQQNQGGHGNADIQQ